MGEPNVDLANMIIEDQQSQHGDPKFSVKPTPEPTLEPITPIAQNPTPQPISTPEAQNPTLETVNSVTQNPEPTPEPMVKVHSFLIYKHLLI